MGVYLLGTNELSKYEQESHMRILDQSVQNEKFEGIFEGGTFKEPAVVMSFKKMPNKNYFNMLVNSLKIGKEEDWIEGKVYLYFYLKGTAETGLMLGTMDKTLDNIYLIEELLRRFEVDLVELNEGKISDLNYLNYIENMKL